MNLFEAVKQSVTTRQAAEHYGLSVNRFGKAACPFHQDRVPSMKVDKRFHCFGCGADGDVIDSVAKLYGVDAKNAAEKLAEDFHIAYGCYSKGMKRKPLAKQKNPGQMYQDLERKCYRVLSDYFHLLRQWEGIYAPKSEDETWHPLFVEALQCKTHIEYLLDVLLYDPIEERAALIKEYGKEVMKLEQRLSEFGTGTERSLADDVGDPAMPDSG